MKIRLALLVAFALLIGLAQDRAERFRNMSAQRDASLADDPFVGVTADGKAVPGLYSIRSSGVPTDSVRQAAEAFLAALSAEQRDKTVYPIEDPEWRKWMNQHFYIRQGVGLDEMDKGQREAAFALLRAALSEDGFELTRDIMRLNHTLGELNDDNFVEYGEWLYWITVMGEPSGTEPWGFQLDGHHVIINYFVLGDQVVMTPLFVGSEPVIATAGKFKGVAIMQREQNDGLALIRALDEAQRERAILEVGKDGNNNVSEAFKDNVKLDYSGVRVADFSEQQQKRLLELVALYVSNMAEGHAKVKMDEVRRHLDQTYFAWIGGADDDSVFYYRIHSPVLLIEFDHQRPAGLRHIYPNKPFREHVHAVVRTPNGNDLLRQHYARHPHGS